MLRKLRSVGDGLLFSHLYLSLAAISQVLLTDRVFKISTPYPILVLLFLSTYATYSFSLVNFRWKGIRSDGSPRQNFIAQYYKPLKVSILLSGLLILILLIEIPNRIRIIFLSEAGIAFFYTFPFMGWKGGKINFRKIPGIKNLIISLLWASSVVFIPLYYARGNFIFHSIPFYYFFSRALILLFVITLLFDFRDIEIDQSKNTITLSSLLGDRNTINLSLLLWLVLILLNYRFHTEFLSTEYWSLNLSSLLLLLLIYLTKTRRSDYFYMIFLDGIIFIQYPLVLLLSFLF